MTTVARIQPPIELETPRGRARAHFLLDYGADTSLVWVCFVRATGECWCVRNEEVREVRDDTWSLPGGAAVEAAGGPRAAGAATLAGAPAAPSGDPSQAAAGAVPAVGDGAYPAAARAYRRSSGYLGETHRYQEWIELYKEDSVLDPKLTWRGWLDSLCPMTPETVSRVSSYSSLPATASRKS